MKSNDKVSKEPKGGRSTNKPAGASTLRVRKWGNSAGLRIPMSMMYAAKFKLDDELEAHVENDKIVLQRSEKKRYALKDLLVGVTPEKCKDSFEGAAPAGKEFW